MSWPFTLERQTVQEDKFRTAILDPLRSLANVSFLAVMFHPSVSDQKKIA
jgi:hypothetical protein